MNDPLRVSRHLCRACPVTLDSSGDGPLAEADSVSETWRSWTCQGSLNYNDPHVRGIKECKAMVIFRGFAVFYLPRCICLEFVPQNDRAACLIRKGVPPKKPTPTLRVF